MGLAVLVAHAGVDGPGQLTGAHLDAFAALAYDAFFTPAGAKNSTVLFTRNFPATHPSTAEPQRQARTRSLLGLYRLVGAPDGDPCVFCGRPSVAPDGQPLGVRDRVPLFPARDVVNFFPYGRLGSPVCGACLFAILALVVGAPLVEGRILVVEAEDPRLVIALVRHWLPLLRQRLLLSRATGDDAPPLRRPLSNVMHALSQLHREIQHLSATGLTVYLLSNSGQGADLMIHHLPAPLVRVVATAQGASLRPAWQHLVRRGRASGDEDGAESWIGRNRFYEALATLPSRLETVVAQHLLPAARHRPEGPVALWPLTALILKEVAGMEEARVDALRQIADRLAEHIARNRDRRLFSRLYRARGDLEMRRLLLRASMASVGEGAGPVATFDEFVAAFDVADEAGPPDWRLAWDLILVRLLDRLWQDAGFRRLLQEEREEEEDEEEGA